MERNLPIQLVETRGKQDIFLKEGFGNDVTRMGHR